MTNSKQLQSIIFILFSIYLKVSNNDYSQGFGFQNVSGLIWKVSPSRIKQDIDCFKQLFHRLKM